MKNKIAAIGTIDVKYSDVEKRWMDISLQYPKDTIQYKVDPMVHTVCTIRRTDAENLARKTLELLLFYRTDWHPDIRNIARYFPYFSNDGIVMLNEFDIITDGKDFISTGYKTGTYYGKKITNFEIIKLIKKEMKLIENHVKTNLDKTIGVPVYWHMKLAYYKSWIKFLEKNEKPFIGLEQKEDEK